MSYHLLFLSATPLLSSSAHACPSRNLRCHVAPRAVTPQPSSPAKLVSATNVSQTARVIMSLFQLSTFVTPVFINPLYTSHILTTLPQNYPVIQALGLTNLSTFLVFHAHRQDARSSRVVNTLIFAATAAVYLIIPVKPQHINIPFTLTLGFIALANVFFLPKNHTLHQSTKSLPALVRLVAGFATIVSAFLNPLPLQRVYIFQIGLNLAATAALASRSDSTDRILFVSDITLLLATAVCLSQSATMIPAVMLAVTALFQTTHLISSPDNLPRI